MLLKENITGEKACYKTEFSYRKCYKYLRFTFKAHHSALNSYSDKYNDELYKADVCELFIRYGKENHYYEIEVAPNGATFLADIENINGNFHGNLIDDCFIKTTSKIKKDSYTVKILIPKSYIKTRKIEFNAFRIETDGERPEKHLFALHPTLCGSFHKPEYIK